MNQKGHGTKPPRACARDEGQQLGRAASPSGHSLSKVSSTAVMKSLPQDLEMLSVSEPPWQPPPMLIPIA